jgi:hypothetical protein
MPTFVNLKQPKGPGFDHAEEADRLVNGDRQADYGSPKANYEAIAAVFTGVLRSKLRVPISAKEAALCMVGVKIAREAHKHKRDNLVDAHGYLLVAAHCLPSEEPCPKSTRKNHRRSRNQIRRRSRT